MLGFLPLLICLFYSILQITPFYRSLQASYWAEQISQQTGFAITLAAVASPTPEQTVLHELVIRHPESGVRIGVVRQATFFMEKGQRLVELEDVSLEREQIRHAWEILHDSFFCRPDRYGTTAHFASNRLTIRDANQEFVMHDVSIKHLPSGESLMVAIDFDANQRIGVSQTPHVNEQISVSEETALKPKLSRVIIKRFHAEDQLLTKVHVRSQVRLPLGLFRGISPALDSFGENAKFTGVMDLDQTPASWTFQLHDSNVWDVNFAALYPHSPAPISGTGILTVHETLVRNDRLEYLFCTADIGPGRIASGLLQSLAKHLGLQANQRSPVLIHAFDHGAVTFRIQPGSIQLVGRLAGGAIFTDAIGPLAQRPESVWEERLSLERFLNVARDETSSSPNAEIPKQLSRRLLTWLPLDSSPGSNPESTTRISQTPTSTR